MKRIHAINPEALMFGTDLPSTRANRPFSIHDVTLIREHFGPTDAHRILVQNATDFYAR